MTIISDAIVEPAFLNGLRHAHYARLVRCVVLTGNIYDIFPTMQDGKVKYVPLDELLETALRRAKYPEQQADERFTVINVKSDGLNLPAKEDANEHIAEEIKEARGKDATPLSCIKTIARLLREVAETRTRIAAEGSDHYIPPLCIIFDQAETIFPNAKTGAQDRDVWRWFSDLVREEKLWANAETANQRPDLIILLSPTISELNPKIFSLPKTELLEIPLPSNSAGLLPPNLEEDARGLTMRAIDDLVVSSRRDPQHSPLARQAIVAEVTKRLQLELKDTVKKLVRPAHTMRDDVMGFSKLKPRLRHLARRIDNSKHAPVGMVVVGPNGAGKTFIIEAWAAEMERTVLTMAGGMKSKWYGETGVFLETFEKILSVYGRTCIIIDEAHKAFASIHNPDTYQTDAEYARHIIQMMSNPKYRAKVFWVLITTRPDLLDPDFKRSGRCSLFVPVCDPEEKDADDFFSWTMRSFEQEGLSLDEETRKALLEKTRKDGREFSAGDYRRFIDELLDEQDYQTNELHLKLDISKFIQDWKPSAARIGQARRLHTLLAAKDADWRELLPAKLSAMSEEAITQEINALKLFNLD